MFYRGYTKIYWVHEKSCIGLGFASPNTTFFMDPMYFRIPLVKHCITNSTRFNICSSGEVNSGERYPNRVVSFGLNRAYIKNRTPNSCCADNTWFFEYFYRFLGFVVLEISGHFGGVYQSRYCASDGAFLLSFVYVMYLNITSYLYGKQIKSKLGNTMCLWMIFICVHLNRLGPAWSQWVPYQDP